MNTVNICDYSETWAQNFSDESRLIKSTISFTKIYIDHVGSTSVKGLSSKPIVDMLISISDWTVIEKLLSELIALGYHIREKCNDTPRIFLAKYASDDSGSYHVHVCKPNSRWGRNMLIFKNELVTDKEFAKTYVDLKRRLAIAYHNNVQGYGEGKKNFIDGRLREIDGEFSVDRLLSHQRAESNRAERLQILMIMAQLSIAVIAAFSVYSNDNKYLFVYAIAGFVLMLVWFYLSQWQLSHRSAGDQARRAVLLMSGLEMVPSAGQQLRISDGFKVDVPPKSHRREEDHFATRETPGDKRLAEMIEESSYWTRDLQRTSSKVMAALLFAFVATVLGVSGAAVASFESDNLISLSRVMIAIMVFVISSDALGLLLSYKNSASTIDEVFKRVEAVASRGYEKSDVLLLMSDYNAAIERAPATLPWVYRWSHTALNRRWQAYMEAKLVGGLEENAD
ncbi:GrpB family protein [Pseudomonas sp. Pseusp122]|uniref:GrpB family protein n=1 Tax=unclassified Pseudomonas TaxID=196821 RepID=UPI0039A43A45